jgi:hypothetical protein
MKTDSVLQIATTPEMASAQWQEYLRLYGKLSNAAGRAELFAKPRGWGRSMKRRRRSARTRNRQRLTAHARRLKR